MKTFIVTIICIILTFGKLHSQAVISADTTWGCDELNVTFSLSPANVYDTVSTMLWTFGDGETVSNVNSPVHEYSQAGKYFPSVLLNNKDLLIFESGIDVHFEPNAFFSWRDTTELGPYFYLLEAADQPTDTLNYTYTWGIENSSSLNGEKIIHDFSETGSYSVLLMVSHNYGCYNSQRQEIIIATELDCPNVFTPNQDGINDYFKVSTNGLNLYSFSVYTRAGALIYKTESPQVVWDGRSLSGNEVQPGIYYYLIEQLDGDARTVKKGFIHLLK